jgi:F-type H+-transporting ATPase subunit alpha
LFYAGVRPAINVGLSVSRVGGSAQTRAMRRVAGRLRLDLAQYREMAAFAQFGSELDAATQAQLARGARLVEILKQDQYEPMSFAQQVVVIFAAINGFLDDVPVETCRDFARDMLQAIETRSPQIMRDIVEARDVTEEIDQALRQAITTFKASATATVGAA